MITKDRKVILLVESSSTLSKILKDSFENEGYKVLICPDGLEALHLILNQSPDCIIANKVISSINGYQLCSIVKNGTELYSRPFILYQTEDESYDFWDDTNDANESISINGQNIDELLQIVKRNLDDSIVDTEFFTADNEDDLLEAVTSGPRDIIMSTVAAMDKSNFYYNMTREIFALNHYIEDLDEFLEQTFLILKRICKYDAAVIIISDLTAKVYYTGLEMLSEEDVEAFLEICKREFEKHVNSGLNFEYQPMEGMVDNPLTSNKLSSYINFPIQTDSVIGTIHLASASKRGFTDKTQSSVQFLANKMNYMLEDSMLHRRITISERRLREAFSKFVPKEIIDSLLDQIDENVDETQNNQKRRVAVLMCDIRNFTSISEINQPENVVHFLNKYFSQMVEIIKSHGGSIDKFIGDCIMALFGAPISYIDNAKRAVETALEMMEELSQVDTSLLNFPDGMKFDIGIGIHQGEMIVGNIGSKDKTNYTVIGDAVNLSSRIEGLTKQYGSRILISEAVKNELDESFNCFLLDKVMVKGKKQGVKIYRVDEKPLAPEFTKNYGKGLNLYFNGGWSLALSYFKKAQEILPGDKAAKLMIQRCEEFIENPPEDWTGAIALTSK